MNGMLNVLKPPGMTSHDVVYWLRKTTGQKKAGHTGTLDPGAAGVLPVCLGKATKVIEYLPDQKQYRAEIVFGRSTTTQDSFGRTVEKFETSGLEPGILEQNLAGFRGCIEQIPPMVSAVKHKGKKLYELARIGIEVERKPRAVHIYELTLISFSNRNPEAPRAIIDVHCSAGTYIRTLCHDLGNRIGCGAYMSFLLRTKAGAFSLENTVTLEKILEKSQNGTIGEVMVSMSKALEHLPGVEIPDTAVAAVRCGNKLLLPAASMEQPVSRHQVARMEGPAGLLALAAVERPEGKSGYLLFQPLKVLV